MEREGEGRGRGRRGGEMRKGLVIGGMVLGLLMGCNNGGELEAEKRLGEIGRSAENAFYEFIDLVAGTLGFTVTKETTKQRVGQHFTDLGKQLEKASNGLEEVAKKAVVDGDKDGILSKAIRSAVDAAKTTLNELKRHLESLKEIGDGKPVGDAETTNTQGKAANEGELKKAYEALKGIVDIAKEQKVDEPKKSELTLGATSIGIASAETGSKILGTNTGPGAAVGEKAATIVAAVSGEEILESIVKSTKDKAVKIGSAATVNTTPLEFAMGGNMAHVANDATPKAAAVAGGIALRSLIKDGKLASNGSNDDKAAQSAGVTAVNKLLVAVEDIIKKTVKNVIGKARVEIDKARDSETTVQQ